MQIASLGTDACPPYGVEMQLGEYQLQSPLQIGEVAGTGFRPYRCRRPGSAEQERERLDLVVAVILWFRWYA
jgi:hypothetical protein